MWGEKVGWGDVEGEMGEVSYGKEQSFFFCAEKREVPGRFAF